MEAKDWAKSASGTVQSDSNVRRLGQDFLQDFMRGMEKGSNEQMVRSKMLPEAKATRGFILSWENLRIDLDAQGMERKQILRAGKYYGESFVGLTSKDFGVVW